MKIKLITFSNCISDTVTYFGFQVLPAKDAAQYINCVKLLEENRKRI